MNTRTKPAASHLARLLLGASLFTTLLGPAIPAKAATQEYWVDIVLTRGTGISDEIWVETWVQFRDAFLPSFQTGLPGNAQFRVSADLHAAHLYLVNATTTNFAQTRSSFRSIPSMIPAIPEMSVSINGPYLGDPPPLAGMTFGGKGDGSGRFKVLARIREGRSKVFKCKADNNTGGPLRLSYRMSGSAFNRRNCNLRVKDVRGTNVTALLKRGRYAELPFNLPANPVNFVSCTVRLKKRCNLAIRLVPEPQPIYVIGSTAPPKYALVPAAPKTTLCRVGLEPQFELQRVN